MAAGVVEEVMEVVVGVVGQVDRAGQVAATIRGN